MAKAGIRDIFLPYNILGAAKLDRLINLVNLIHLSVTADLEIVVRGLSMAAHKNNCDLEVLVECDTGEGRCGVQSPQAAADLAILISNSPGLIFGGLMAYCTSANTAPFIREAKRIIESHGIQVIRVTGGGTPSASNPENLRDVTEHRGGVYVYGDRHTVRSGAMTLSDCSFSVLSTVVSRPTLSRGILDAGSKTLSSDLLDFDGYGMIFNTPRQKFTTFLKSMET